MPAGTTTSAPIAAELYYDDAGSVGTAGGGRWR
jgi:NaMN:DMB phosphoribosyltransferase